MANKDYWTPQLEAKLHAWHKMQQLADLKKPAPCFTIAREFGCQGYPLAEALVKRLNARASGDPWVVIGHEVLDEVAKLSGYTVDQIEKSRDTPASLKAIFSLFLDRSRAEETEVFSYMREVVKGFAKRGNCVIVGRGGAFVAQDLPNCIHLRLVAPYEFRVEKIMKAHGMGRDEAEKFIDLHQGQREKFIRRLADERMDNPHLYHLIINNSRMDIENIAELVDDYLIKTLL